MWWLTPLWSSVMDRTGARPSPPPALPGAGLPRSSHLQSPDWTADATEIGMFKRVARALAVGASVLLADEPAAHLDPAHQLQLMELLRVEAARGTAVIVTLHDLSLASRFCDRIVVMNEGQVAAEGTAVDALTDDVLRSVFEISARRLETGIVPWQRI